MKFGRNYRLTIEMNDGSGAIIIEPPFTIQFTINRSVAASLNTMDIAIYNLGDATRNRIYQDRYNTELNHKVTLEAGYGGDLSTIFVGTIFEANSQREGTNMVTNINSRDGGFDVTSVKTYRTVQKGATAKEVVQGLIGDFKTNPKSRLTQGKIGDFPDTFQRPVVLEGNTYNLIQKYTNNSCYIDLEKVYVLKDNEVITGDIPLISSETGLLMTPRRDDSFLCVSTLFEPRILMGQIVQLDSLTQKQYNGQYKVYGVAHQGIISGAVGGKCVSIFNLLTGNKPFGGLKTV